MSNRVELYGLPPKHLGVLDLDVTEFMCWLYCPIKAPQGNFHVPEQLQQFWPMIHMALQYATDKDYIYVTAKRLYVTPDNKGNREGWHSDGFMTNDLNFVWSDANPTLFWEPTQLTTFSQDHTKSLKEMETLAEPDTLNHVTYPVKSVLLLDQYVIHRVADFEEAGMRTFVKVSVSQNKYDLEGNSKNNAITKEWKYVKRNSERNAPSSVEVSVHW